MEAWGWIIVFAVGLTALQLLLYRYLVGRRDVSEEARSLVSDGDDTNANANRTTPSAEWSSGFRNATVGAQVHRAPETDDGRRCPRCGAENEVEQAYSRCWNCARRIA